ncbi:hypothetical protein, partial [Sphingobium sp.]|uniref:hypothetical protein n=1 Tax=Sphingobium sp. TaxID=1912891 RepID=UPI0035C740F4
MSWYNGPANNAAITASSDGINFVELSMGAFGKTAGAAIYRALGKEVRFLRGGVSGTTLAQWEANGFPQRAVLVQAILAAGGADAILLQVGRNDAALRLIESVDSQVSLQKSLVSKLRSEASIPNAFIFVGGSQGMVGGDAEQHNQIAMHRFAEIRLTSEESGCRFGFSTYDLETFDTFIKLKHRKNISGMRFADQVVAWFLGAQEKRSPQIKWANLVSKVETNVELQIAGGPLALERR